MSASVRHLALLTCAEVVEHVSELLGPGMPALDRVRLEQHLLVCPPCTSYVQQMRDTIALARELHPAPVAAADSALAAFAMWKASTPAVPRTVTPRAIGVGPLPFDELPNRSVRESADANGRDAMLLRTPSSRIAYKFLRKGAFGPMSGAAWPTQGAWMSASGPLVVGRNGMHVCRAEALAHWMHDELWEIEIAGEQLAGPDCVVVERARPTRRIDTWSNAAADMSGATRFANACITRARERVGDSVILRDGEDALRYGYPAVAAFNAALAITGTSEDAFAQERRWQSDWIAREIAKVLV